MNPDTHLLSILSLVRDRYPNTTANTLATSNDGLTIRFVWRNSSEYLEYNVAITYAHLSDATNIADDICRHFAETRLRTYL